MQKTLESLSHTATGLNTIDIGKGLTKLGANFLQATLRGRWNEVSLLPGLASLLNQN